MGRSALRERRYRRIREHADEERRKSSGGFFASNATVLGCDFSELVPLIPQRSVKRANSALIAPSFSLSPGAMHFDCCFRVPRSTAICLFNLRAMTCSSTSPLARCERVEAARIFRIVRACSRRATAFFQWLPEWPKQIFSVHGFGEEIKRATFHRLHTLRTSPWPVRKNNRKSTACLAQFV